MIEKLKTCGQCEHLEAAPMGPVMRAYGCGQTGIVVPHTASLEDNGAVFRRIPMACPRPADEVEKSQENQPEAAWDTINWAAPKQPQEG